MGNIMDYINWRGDLSFEQSKFNEVDNLILACFSYVNLDGIQQWQTFVQVVTLVHVQKN